MKAVNDRLGAKRANAESRSARLVARPFLPGSAAFGGDTRRLELIVDRILDLSPEIQSELLAETLHRSIGRHRNIRSTWLGHFEMACEADVTIQGRCQIQMSGSSLGPTSLWAMPTRAPRSPTRRSSRSATRAEGSQPFVMSARRDRRRAYLLGRLLHRKRGAGGEPCLRCPVSLCRQR